MIKIFVIWLLTNVTDFQKLNVLTPIRRNSTIFSAIDSDHDH